MSDNITWVCDVCGLDITAEQDGHVYTRSDDEARFRRETDEHAEKHPETMGRFSVYSGTALMDLPDPIHWHVAHLECDPEPDRTDYWIGVGDLGTFRQVTRWTAHLLEKSWLDDTDWRELIGRLAREGTNRMTP